MINEIKSLINNTNNQVMLFEAKKVQENKLFYRFKIEEHCTQLRCKARSIVKGFNKKKSIYFEEIFSLVVKMSSIRVVLMIITA